MIELFLKAVISASEKAANIARLCRKNEHLFQLLIEEKKSDEANPRFVSDFKTLADVLIQEAVKHDLGKMVIYLSKYFIYILILNFSFQFCMIKFTVKRIQVLPIPWVNQ